MKRAEKIALVAMAAVFLLHAVLFFTRTAPSLVNSDAAAEVQLTALALEAKSPLVSNFYYVNGDYWIFGAQWFAWPLLLLFGETARALLATNVLSLVLDVGILYWAFRKLDSSPARALFAALVVLFAWSAVHMQFEYAELAYSMLATAHCAVFVLYAQALATRRRRDVVGALVFFFLFAVQNPQRAVAYELLPVLAGCLWKWDDGARRARLQTAALTGGTWLVAAVLHRFVLTPFITPAVQNGMSLGLRGPAGWVTNVVHVLQGTALITAPRNDLPWTAVFGLAVVAGAGAWTVRFALRSKAYEPARFVAIVLLAEVALVLVLFVFGDMLTAPMTVRYIMPGLLPLLGLGVVLAAREERLERLALAWLCLLPVDAAIATTRRVWGAREVYAEADPLRLQGVAAELVRRDLRHGFATYWNANTTTLLAGGATKTCGVAFREGYGLVPRKWLVDTRCFRAATLPESIYVVAAPGERAQMIEATAKTQFPEPRERFEVDGFEVRVYRTAECPLAWLELAKARL